MSQIILPGGARGIDHGEGAESAGIQVKCPRCQMPFAAPIVNVVDVKRYPQLKAALLSGLLNRAACPACGAVALLNVPLVYHDPDKELLLVYLPAELNLSAEQQQRLIGGLVQAVMAGVPAEERKGYFLRPQTVLSRQRLVEQILEADGITPEMLEEQNRRLQLLEDLVRARNDPARLQSLIEEHRADINYAFFVTLLSAAQEADLAGARDEADELFALRDQLLQDPELAGRLPQRLPPGVTVEAAVEKLLPLMDDREALAAMVTLNRPVFDYVFFQGLTHQLERARAAGDAARAERLMALRARLLEEIQRQDQDVQAAQEEDLRLAEEILNSPDQQAAIRRHLPRLDTFFLSTLEAAIRSARREGNIERSARLDGLRRAILDALAQTMPPELQLINRLLSLEKPEERKAVLNESAALLSNELESLVRELWQELQGQGQVATAGRLQVLLTEIQQARAAASANPS